MKKYRVFYSTKSWELAGISLEESNMYQNDNHYGYIDDLPFKKGINLLELKENKAYCFEEIGTYVIKKYFEGQQSLIYDIASTNKEDLNKFLSNFDISEYKKYARMNYHRGDLAISKIKGNFLIIDFKNYSNIMATWKPSKKVDLNQFTKTVDTNLKKIINDQLLPELFNNKKLEEIIDLFKNNISFELNSEQFLNIINYFELGPLAVKIVNREKINGKVFIRSYDKENYITFENIDFNLIKQNNNVKVEFYQDIKTKYNYIQFYNNNELLYEVSMRGDLNANCAFINKKLLNIVYNEDNLDAIDFVIREVKKRI